MAQVRMHSPPARTVKRPSFRWQRQRPITRGRASDHGATAPPATGATAGIPGTWTPPGSTPPASPAAMTGIVASPGTAWTSGQYVQTGTAGAAGRTTWTGSAWVGGAAPLAVFDPSGHTIVEVQEYVTNHPDEREAILAAEQAGQNRVTLVSWLQA